MRSDKLARLILPYVANGRDAVAPLPFDASGRVERPRSTAADRAGQPYLDAKAHALMLLSAHISRGKSVATRAGLNENIVTPIRL